MSIDRWGARGGSGFLAWSDAVGRRLRRPLDDDEVGAAYDLFAAGVGIVDAAQALRARARTIPPASDWRDESAYQVRSPDGSVSRVWHRRSKRTWRTACGATIADKWGLPAENLRRVDLCSSCWPEAARAVS